MPSQPSQIRIANRALTLVGTGNRVLTLEDDTPEARTLAALWDAARDALLVEHPWNFAIRRESLPANAVAPAYGYARAYTLPTDCLRWLPTKPSGRWPVEQEGSQLLSDADAPLPIRYIARVEDVALWSEGFSDAMARRLAAEAAEPLTADKGTGDRLWHAYAETLQRAKRQDGLATGNDRSGNDESATSSWLYARAGYSGFDGYDW